MHHPLQAGLEAEQVRAVLGLGGRRAVRIPRQRFRNRGEDRDEGGERARRLAQAFREP